jgi:ABC-type oligopeptide transport system substrate-binding subunit
MTWLTVGGTGSTDQYSLVAQQNLKAIGINVKIEEVEASVYGSRIAAGDYDLFVTGLFDYTDYPDVPAGLALLSTSGLHVYFGAYKSKALDAAVTRALAAKNGAVQKAAVHRLNVLFGKLLPIIPLVQFTYVSGSRVPKSVFRVNPTSLYQVVAQGGQFVP